MATLTVWKFPTASGADDAIDTLRSLEKQELITVHDAATVSWEEGAKRPRTRQLDDLVGSGALGGTFWGLLLGTIFFVPLLGAALGAAMGAAGGALSDVGTYEPKLDGFRRFRGRRPWAGGTATISTTERVSPRVARLRHSWSGLHRMSGGRRGPGDGSALETWMSHASPTLAGRAVPSRYSGWSVTFRRLTGLS